MFVADRKQTSKLNSDPTRLTFCTLKCSKASNSDGRLASKRTAAVKDTNDIHGSEILEKRRTTMINRYGVDNSMHVDHIRERAIAAMRARTVDQKESALAKREMTCMKRYGVRCTFQSEDLMQHVDVKQRRRAAHETMKRRGTYASATSRGEERLYEMLAERFGSDDVTRHVSVNGWCIDLHVESIDAYIQFDGVYWHGLDRPIEVIRKFNTPRDRVIYETWRRDRQQNAWFRLNGLTLLRVTDADDLTTFVATL